MNEGGLEPGARVRAWFELSETIGLIPRIAALLYPEAEEAERETMLLQTPEMKRLKTLCVLKAASLRVELGISD